MLELISNSIENAASVLLILNAIIFIISSKRHKSNRCYILFKYYLVLMVFIDLLGFYLSSNGMTNLYLSHYYFVLQFILLSLFYRGLLNKYQIKYVSVVLLIVIGIIASRFILNPLLYYEFDLIEIFLCSLPLVVYSIIHLYNSLSEARSFLYINAGVLIYLSTSTLIFILGNYLSARDLKAATAGIWMINDILYLGYLILIFIEWFKNYRQIKVTS